MTHVLRDGAGERAGVAPGDEPIAVAGWRLRRLDDAPRAAARKGRRCFSVGRDQRVLSLPLDVASLAATEAGAKQLKPAEKADATARVACTEAWIAG